MSTQLDILTQINLDDLVASFGWQDMPLLAALVRRAFVSPARKFARQMVDFDNLIGQTSSLFDVLAFIAMIVASLGVVNTMTMNVLERTRELGMLRSLGMTRWQVTKMILAEALLIGVIGGGLGLLFGLFQSRVVISTVNSTAGYDLTYILPTQGIIVSLVIALFVSQLAAILPAARAARLRIIEAIQFE